MRACIEILLSLLAVAGLLGLGWLGFGYLLSPAGGSRGVCVVPGEGDGGELEQAVTGLLWLMGGGLMGGRVVIADCGLTPEGLAVAQRLCRREPTVALLPVEGLEGYIRAWRR